MNSIELVNDTAKITHVNTRLEKHGTEEKVLGTDVNILAEVSANFLSELAIGETIDYEKFLFDEKGQPLNNGLKSLIFDRQYEDHNIDIIPPTLNEDVEINLHDVKIKMKSASPVFGGRVALLMQIQCHPTEEQRELLLKTWTGGDCSFRLKKPNQTDLVDGAEAGSDNVVSLNQ